MKLDPLPRSIGAVLALPALLLPSAAPLAETAPLATIQWEKDWDAAFERAGKENRVLFLAVNMDGEKANDELAKRAYSDKEIVALSLETVNLVASGFEHSKSGRSCKRFDGVTCDQHRSIDQAARGQVLKPGPDGSVIAPQHVFLDPGGGVILSVPYALQKQELIWCFVTAQQALRPNEKIAMPAGARAPKRLIMGGVYDTGQAASRPLTESELDETIEELRSNNRNTDTGAILRILATDHPEAVKFASQSMGDVRLRKRPELRTTLIRAIGQYSPTPFWETLRIFAMDRDVEVRCEAAAALEQLGNEDALKDLKSFYKKEKESRGRKNFLRAIGTCGVGDKGTLRTLLKTAESDKDELVRRNAILALGSRADREEVQQFLIAGLAAEHSLDRAAAALAMAFSRKEGFGEALKTAFEKESDEPTREILGRVRSVLAGENLSTLRDDYASVGGDTIPRPRFFGVGTPDS